MGEIVETGKGSPTSRSATEWWCRFRLRAATAGRASHELYSLCENSNPNSGIAEKLFGHSTAGIFGYSHIAGGQAEYARVPYADVGPFRIEDDLTDEQVLFLWDIFPTGFFGADLCDIEGGEVIAGFGAGPVGQFAIASAVMLGAERVIAIDQYDYRIQMALNKAGATDSITFSEDPDIVEQLKEMTGGRGPRRRDRRRRLGDLACHGALHAVDRAKQATRSESDRGHALRDAIMACRPGGIVSVIGVYGGLVDKFPSGAF